MKKSILYAAAATAACVTLVGVPAALEAQQPQPAAGANAAARQVSDTTDTAMVFAMMEFFFLT